MFKICSIGCGAMARTGHGPSFAKYKNDYDDVCLAACCDVNEEAAKSFKEQFGFEAYYTDYKKMLDEVKPDVVSLLCPVHLTCPMSIDIMKKGYNIIMEKPPGKNAEEIGLMLKAAKESGVNVRTAFNRRYTPLILKLKELLAKDEGKVLNITYQMYRTRRYEEDFATTAIHAIDVVKDIIGADYKDVSFTYQQLPEFGRNVKNIAMNAIMENDVLAQISFMPAGGSVVERITVNTVDNSYFVELPFWNNIDVPGKLCHVKVNYVQEVITGDTLSDSLEMFELSGFYEENRLFFEHIRHSDEVICDLESAIQSVELEHALRTNVEKYSK